MLLWAERLLVFAGAALLAWCAVVISDAVMAQRGARAALEAAVHPEKPVLPAAAEGARAAAPGEATVHTGAPIAALSIPRVELSSVVLHGSDPQTLRRGPGHLENTPLPGEPGNVVIAGHRDSFFWPLRNIRLGDDIFLDTPEDQPHYRVTSLRVVTSSDLSVLRPTDEDTLTLITCYPFWVFGNAPDRFVVRATAVARRAAAAAARDATAQPAAGDRLVGERPIASVAVPTTRGVVADEVLVGQVLERFRVAYNARISRASNDRPEALRFRACKITIIENRATAICTADTRSPSPEPDVRTFVLERAGREWAIKSIVVNETNSTLADWRVLR